jgi:hypothetical protein
MKAFLVILLFIVIAVVLAFNGVHPFSDVKNAVQSRIVSGFNEPEISPEISVNSNLTETVIIPHVLIFRSDGRYFDYRTREEVSSDDAIRRMYEYENKK